MPSLRLQFPEKESFTTLGLRGPRITVGRRANCVLQILDRTLSGVHAEFVSEEDGIYRLRDLGSTNGTFVNGSQITDWRLTEACQVGFGSVICEFDPGAPGEASDAITELLPTRTELEALKHQNRDLQRQVETLREEVAGLKGHTVASDAGADATSESSQAGFLKAELQRLVAERSDLKEIEQRQSQELARLEGELALVKRDRTNLQNALRQLNATELARTRKVDQPSWNARPKVPNAQGANPATIPAPPVASKSGPLKPVPASAAGRTQLPGDKSPASLGADRMPTEKLPVLLRATTQSAVSQSSTPQIGTGGGHPFVKPATTRLKPIGPTGTTRILLPRAPSPTEKLSPARKLPVQTDKRA